MNDRQFEQLLHNVRRAAPKPLFEGKAAAAVIRSVTRRARSYQAGVDAWARVSRPEWRPYTEFESHENGVFRVSVSHPLLACELNQQAPAIKRLLASQIAGVVSVQFQPVAKLAGDSQLVS